MFSKAIVHTLDLFLDYKNPRFKLPQDPASPQDQIIKYLLRHEDALVLAKGLAKIETLLPGERIVVCKEDNKYIVLEGNRRVCICKLFLDRSLIPTEFQRSYPVASQTLLNNITEVEVDIIPSREEAKKYLAARHIQGVKEWSTVAKMRFSYEEYNDGKSIEEIVERTYLSQSQIKKFIKDYKLLNRGLNSSLFNLEEKNRLSILDVEPDKLLRAFNLRDTKKSLGLSYDDTFTLISSKLSSEDLDEIIYILTKKAFLENEINTRTPYYSTNGTSVYDFIKHILDKYEEKDTDTQPAPNPPSAGKDTPPPNGSDSNTPPSPPPTSQTTPPSNTPLPPSGGPSQPQGGPAAPAFFSALYWGGVDPDDSENFGILAVCNEIKKFSGDKRNISNFPIAASFLIRNLIEHSLKYYARKNGFWSNIKTNPKDQDPKLSAIIKYYHNNLSNIFTDSNRRSQFSSIFSSQTSSTTSLLLWELNSGVHSPESFIRTPLSLLKLPAEGLLDFISFLLS